MDERKGRPGRSPRILRAVPCAPRFSRAQNMRLGLDQKSRDIPRPCSVLGSRRRGMKMTPPYFPVA